MLDIHPPHAPTHTWKDFFIHIATIVVGLLIAVGLEQTVEMIHHNRERNELSENLHDEAEQNLPVLKNDYEAADADSRWERDLLVALENPTDTGTVLTVILPKRGQAPADHSPDRAAWPVAKANGKAALLPESLAAIYDRCDTDAGESFTAFSERLQAGTQADAAEKRFGLQLSPGTVVRLSPGARDELARTHAILLGKTRSYAFWTLAYYGCANAIAHNAKTRAEVDSYYGGFSSVLSK